MCSENYSQTKDIFRMAWYKTPMYWWVYLIAFAIIAVITILTVTFQNWRAANENPVHSIKNE